MTPRIGVLLPTRGLVLASSPPDVGRLADLAREAEALGCDSVWVGDSLTAKPRLEPLTVLASVAAQTSRVRIGTAVLIAPLRQPVLLAQATATLDLLSGGRLTLGMGVGGAFTPEQRQEWAAAGVDEHGRGRRLDEIAACLPLLWSGEPATYTGRQIQLDDVSLGFRPPQQPRIPLLLACHSGEGRERQYRRAARLADGLISITDSPLAFGAVRQRVLEEVAAAGRDPSRFGATYYMTVNLNHDVEAARREADTWVRAYYGLNFWEDRWGPFGRPEEVVERAREYVVAGADELIFRFAAPDQKRQLELFGETVLPALRSAG